MVIKSDTSTARVTLAIGGAVLLTGLLLVGLAAADLEEDEFQPNNEPDEATPIHEGT